MKLKEAHAENEKPIPPHVIESFPIPSYAKVALPDVVTALNPASEKLYVLILFYLELVSFYLLTRILFSQFSQNAVQTHVQKDLSETLPYFIQFDSEYSFNYSWKRCIPTNTFISQTSNPPLSRLRSTSTHAISPPTSNPTFKSFQRHSSTSPLNAMAKPWFMKKLFKL